MYKLRLFGNAKRNLQFFIIYFHNIEMFKNKNVKYRKNPNAVFTELPSSMWCSNSSFFSLGCSSVLLLCCIITPSQSCGVKIFLTVVQFIFVSFTVIILGCEIGLPLLYLSHISTLGKVGHIVPSLYVIIVEPSI